jgi:hypothetical protein
LPAPALAISVSCAHFFKMPQPSQYRRLTGRCRHLLSYSQLWLGPDHVLLVKSTRFAEDYRRFAFADIQAISVTDLPDRTIYQIAAGVAALAWTLSVLAVASIAAKIFFAVTGVLALVLVIADLARGTRCRCYLHTAVSNELLHPVSHRPAARVFLSRIRPMIEAVQGTLDTEQSVALQTAAASAPVDRPPEIAAPPSVLPEILFGVFLVNAALVGLDVRFPGAQIGGALLTTFFAEIVLAVVALARRGARDPRRIAYGVIVAALLCAGFDIFGLASSAVNWFNAIADAARAGSRTPPEFAWASSRGASVFAIVWRLAAGVAGLAAAIFERHAEVTE